MKEVVLLGGTYLCGCCGAALLTTYVREFDVVSGVTAICYTHHCPNRKKRFFVPVQQVEYKEIDDAEQKSGTSAIDDDRC